MNLRAFFVPLGLSFCLLPGACSSSEPSSVGSPDNGEEPPDDWVDGKADSQTRLAYNRISTKAQFKAMAFERGGTVTLGPSVKFIIDLRTPSTPRLRFMNANYAIRPGESKYCNKYHYDFARTVLWRFEETVASFNESTYKDNKRFYAGTVQAYEIDGNTLYGMQLYPEDTAAEQAILTAARIVKKGFVVPDVRVAFVATGPQQTMATIQDGLNSIGVEGLTIDQVLAGVNYLPMNAGEAWGYLRVFPQGTATLTPTDIPVFDELPLDLPVVAGTMTRAIQDNSSHVNLKSKERGTPNMVLRDVGPDHAMVGSLANTPVHMVVRADGFTLEPSTDQEVQQKYAERTNKPWQPLSYEPETRVLAFTQMCPSAASDCVAQAKRYGSKAANLGFLTNPSVLGRAVDDGSLSQHLGYDLVPVGVGVPLQFYFDLVGYPPNATLRAKLEALIEAEKAGALSPDARQAAVAEVQQLFYAAQLPPGFVDAIRQVLVQSAPGVNGFKVRSSANAEDMPNFDGAGLYDSFSAKLSATDAPDGSCRVKSDSSGVETKLEMSPKTLACAIKGAYASTWNVRAISERSFARLDHATAGMGLAINAKYDAESDVAANSVAVTRVVGSDGLAGYTFANQVGNNLVTNPTPGTVAESIVAAYSGEFGDPSFMVVRHATPVAGQPPLEGTVYAQDQLMAIFRITRQVETAYCRARRSYYVGDCLSVARDGEKPRALDLEFKFLQNGTFVCKQVREFAGR
ncbi:MAG: PEP/pyruvate-binding domain-containing protein [Polyangiaceae bacterium]|jgi:hypothetical protein|nr:PEP/pyruvate-binding domain-containing protein [Polyangiaceae bacterium]